jgi:hypothetical protein
LRVVDIRKKEDCFDGGMIYEYLFDEGFPQPLMHRLAEGGNLQFFPQFAKPFFKLVTADGAQIKGIIGDRSIEVLFPRTRKMERKAEFEALLTAVLTPS